jgi:hypothetical protein
MITDQPSPTNQADGTFWLRATIPMTSPGLFGFPGSGARTPGLKANMSSRRASHQADRCNSPGPRPGIVAAFLDAHVGHYRRGGRLGFTNRRDRSQTRLPDGVCSKTLIVSSPARQFSNRSKRRCPIALSCGSQLMPTCCSNNWNASIRKWAMPRPWKHSWTTARDRATSDGWSQMLARCFSSRMGWPM